MADFGKAAFDVAKNNDNKLNKMVIVATGVKTIDEDSNYDNSAYLNNLINTAPKGSRIIIPRGRIKANIQVTQSDLVIDHTTGGELTGSSYIAPFDVTKPAFLIGGASSHVRGITIPNLTLLGTSNVNDTNSHGLVIKGARDLNIDNLRVEYFGGHNIYVTSEQVYTSYVNINKVKSRYSYRSNFFIENGAIYTSSVYLGYIQFIQDTRSANGRNITVNEGVDLFITNGWMQGVNLQCVDIYGTTSRIFMNNVYIDSDNTTDTLIKQFDTSAVSVYGSFSCDGYILLKNGSTFKHSTGYLNGLSRVVYKEVVLTDTVNYTDFLQLGQNASYKITIALSDSSNNASAYGFIEIYAVTDVANIKKVTTEIMNSATAGIDYTWKTNTDGSYATDNNRRILQLKTRNALADRWIVKVEIFGRAEHGALTNVTFL